MVLCARIRLHVLRLQRGVWQFALMAFFWIASCNAPCIAVDDPTRIPWNELDGASAAVVVKDVALLHTRQFLPTTEAHQSAEQSASDQLANVLKQARDYLAHIGAADIVKVNLYVTSDHVAEEVRRAFPLHFSPERRPAVSLVVTALPSDAAAVAADFVATADSEISSSLVRSADLGVLPPGARIYVSGQAEQSESIVEATQKTLLSLQRTLRFLGRTDDDVVQLKAFLQPMSDASKVRDVVRTFYGEKSAPPLIFVEWKSSSSTPIEIELIARGGSPASGADAMEFLTPPEMKASPVYCRVCRINHPATIYVSGLSAASGKIQHLDPVAAGDAEVADVFASMKSILAESGSDFQHLAKATYYVSTDSASTSLNRLRPNFYDPLRPPAASKAAVKSVGVQGLGLTMDMIAVPNSVVER